MARQDPAHRDEFPVESSVFRFAKKQKARLTENPPPQRVVPSRTIAFIVYAALLLTMKCLFCNE